MKHLSLIVEGVSEQEIQETIHKNTQGWRLFFIEPTGVDYQFINTFWGRDWDGTPQSMADSIVTVCGIPNTNKHHAFIMQFMLNGQERFLFCSWTKELYDCATSTKYKIEPKYCVNIINKMQELGVL